MNYIKRAIISVAKRPIKSMLLLLTIFITTTLISASFIVLDSTNKIQSGIKSDLGAYASIQTNLNGPINPQWDDSSDNNYNNSSEFISMLESIKKNDSVQTVDYKIGVSEYPFRTFDIMNRYEDCTVDDDETDSKCPFPYRNVGVSVEDFYEIKEDTITITEGRSFNSQEIENGLPAVLIQDSISIVHQDGSPIKVGDVISFELLTLDFDKDYVSSIKEVKSIDVTVIGKFSVPEYLKDKTCENLTTCVNRSNFFPAKFLLDVRDMYIANQKSYSSKGEFSEMDGIETIVQDVLIRIDSVDSIQTVKTDIENEMSYLNGIKYNIVTASDEYDRIMGPMINLNTMSKLFFYAANIVAIIVLTFVILLSLQSRKKELGIYISIGESKKYIISQILFEILFISLLAISMSLISGNMFANNITKNTIQDKIHITGESEQIQTNVEIEKQDIIEKYSLNLSTSDGIKIYAISLTAIALSAVIPMIYILKIDPKKLLM